VETDLRLYLACMPVQREDPTLRVAIGTPLTPRAGEAVEASAGHQDHERLMASLGGSSSSELRISRIPTSSTWPQNLRLYPLEPDE
jgi:hypothetical protein